MKLGEVSMGLPRKARTGDGARKRHGDWGILMSALVFLLASMVLALVWLTPVRPAYAAKLDPSFAATPPPAGTSVFSTPTATPAGPDKVNTPVARPTGSPEPEGGFNGWERVALHDLAEVVGWPTVVAYDDSGRLSVESYISQDEWEAANIRAFDYPAGAAASFQAEQDDARLGGFTVDGADFYSYPAYSATLTDTNGVVIERRFRWLASTWILGTDISGSAAASEGTARLVAEQLLSISVWRGLPPPPSGQAPTPNPTWALPPNATPTGTACPVMFSDVGPDYWAYGYIYRLACAQIVSGYRDGTFRPDSPTTRAQLAKMLVLAQGWTLTNPETPSFHDVGMLHPFYRYVETAAAHGVISGYGDGTFRPDAYVTRAQVAKMFVLAEDWTLDPASPVEIRDVTPDHWAWAYIEAGVQHGLFSGYGDNYFRPAMLATRAQLSKLLVLTVPH